MEIDKRLRAKLEADDQVKECARHDKVAYLV